MTKPILLTRPSHESTVVYLYHYSQLLIDLANHKKIKVVDLAGHKANSKEFQKHIRTPFSLIIFNGHGSAHIVTGHLNQPIITAPVSELNFNEAIVYARSCRAGLSIGPYIVKCHASAFIGYNKDFIFVSDGGNDPQNDTLAKLFLKPSNALVESLINGRSVARANQRSIRLMRHNIRLILKSRVNNRQQIAAFLWHDINCQIILGHDQSKISP